MERNCNPKKLWASPQPIATTPVAIYVRKHSINLPSFDRIIQRVVETGLVQHWESRLLLTHRRAEDATAKLLFGNVGRASNDADELESLKFHHIQGALIFLVAGLGISFATFVAEALHKRNFKVM